MTIHIKDIQENKQLDNIIDKQIDYLYFELLTEFNNHGRRKHKYTIKQQMEINKALIKTIILQSKLLEII
tara:strand:- start:949 stop:1158 length:210 start_codon:yes stop_codon:yes gene_type:complete